MTDVDLNSGIQVPKPSQVVIPTLAETPKKKSSWWGGSVAASTPIPSVDDDRSSVTNSVSSNENNLSFGNGPYMPQSYSTTTMMMPPGAPGVKPMSQSRSSSLYSSNSNDNYHNDNSNYNDSTRNFNNPSSNMGDSLPFQASNRGSGSAQFPSSSYSVGAGMTSAPSSQNSTTRPPLPPAQTSAATSTATSTTATAAVSKEPVGTAAAPGMVGKVIDCHLL